MTKDKKGCLGAQISQAAFFVAPSNSNVNFLAKELKMPRPTSGTTVARPELRAIALEYLERQEDFIGVDLLPFFDVQQQSGTYPVLPVEALLNVPNTRRAPRAPYNRDDWEFENDNFDCVENGWEEPVDDVEEKLYRRFFDAEEIAMMRALGIILRVQEKRIADMLFNASNFSATSLTNEWDDATNATPIADCKAGRKAIHDACGLEPDTLVISYSTFLDLGLVDEIVDRIKYTNADVKRGDIAPPLLAQALGVRRLKVGMGMYNTAKKGQAASLSQLWNNEYAMLCVTNADGDLKRPCVGRTFKWVADAPENTMVESYREEAIRSTVIRVRQHTDEEIILPASAYLMDNVTT